MTRAMRRLRARPAGAVPARGGTQDAKNSFSEVVEQALKDGPQTITRRGKETAVVVSTELFRAWSGRQKSLVEFLGHSPLKGVELVARL